ncbi:putative oleosin [Helianthus annuus]|nr:putative oleosin [Helianthus annuus]KAJ0608620.1 putative oleosin [Helianthus annuus]
MDTQYDTLMPHHQQQQQQKQQQMSTKTMVIAAIVGVTIGGPLLALMSFIFISTMALFVVTSPLLIIFSPVILGAGFVIVAAMAGFGAAGLLAIAGVSALGWVLRSVKSGQFQQGLESVTGKLLETGENVKESVKNTGKEWAGNLKQTVQDSPENVTANRA